MNFANEFALLIAVATPVAVIAGMQAALLFAGERNTLLLPGVGGYPTMASATFPRHVDVKPMSSAGRATPAASNDESALAA